jgi:hypothetical protein
MNLIKKIWFAKYEKQLTIVTIRSKFDENLFYNLNWIEGRKKKNETATGCMYVDHNAPTENCFVCSIKRIDEEGRQGKKNDFYHSYKILFKRKKWLWIKKSIFLE